MTKCQYSGEFKKSKAQMVFIGFSKSEVICGSKRAISVTVGKQPSGVLVNINNWFSYSIYLFLWYKSPNMADLKPPT